MPPAWELITPETASDYLAANYTDNRNARPTWVATLANDIKDGRYTPTHQGIAFDVNNELIDGQHRLMAVVEAGKPIWMLVARGIPLKTVMAIDRGRCRTDADNIQVAFGVHIHHSEVAICRVMNKPWHASPRSSEDLKGEDLMAFFLKHEVAIKFASSGGGRQGYPAVVRAMVAKAYYHVNHHRLEEFHDIMRGVRTPQGDHDSAADKIRSWVTKNSEVVHLAQSRRHVVGLILSAIKSFADYRVVKLLSPVSRDPYPIPGSSTEDEGETA